VAEPIRNYTPQRDVRKELRRQLDTAPVDHAEAVLAAYELLQQAQDHGVLDVLRAGIGAGGTGIGKLSGYASTPEGIRLLRNLLAASRFVRELDPAILDAAVKALAHSRGNLEENHRPPSLLRSVQRLTGSNSRRALALVAGFSESLGSALGNSGREGAGNRPSRKMASGVAVPVVASAIILMVASFWIGRRSSSRPADG
jgi:hypothetical protein